jgi:hypothetical protein
MDWQDGVRSGSNSRLRVIPKRPAGGLCSVAHFRNTAIHRENSSNNEDLPNLPKDLRITQGSPPEHKPMANLRP